MKKKLKRKIFLTVLLSTSLISFSTLKKLNFEKNVEEHKKYDYIHSGTIIAHRGFSSIKNDNSYGSIDEGLNCICTDGIEIDIRYTKDGEIILCHDKSTNHKLVEKQSLKKLKELKIEDDSLGSLISLKDLVLTTDGKLKIDRYSKKVLEKEKYTTLDTVLEKFNSNKTLLIDIKFPNQKQDEFINKIVSIFKDYNGNFNIIFQSKDKNNLKVLKNSLKNYKYQLLISKRNELKNLDDNFDMFGIRKNLVTYKQVKKLLSSNKEVSVWTVNSLNEYNSLKNKIDDEISNVNIITDFPDEICYLENKENNKVYKKSIN